MATTMKAKDDLTAVADDLAVCAAARRAKTAAEGEAAVAAEQLALRRALHPDTHASMDHRVPLDAAERIRAQDRLAVLEPQLRQLHVERVSAERNLAAARRAAEAALYPRARLAVQPLVDRVWEAVAMAAAAQDELDREMGRLNALLGSPRLQWLGWTGLREQLDARRAAR
jgi:hypothetical protein